VEQENLKNGLKYPDSGHAMKNQGKMKKDSIPALPHLH